MQDQKRKKGGFLVSKMNLTANISRTIMSQRYRSTRR